MATLVSTIVDNGFSLSRLSRPELIAAQEATLVRVVARSVQAMFSYAARVNPLYFATQADVAFAAGGWTRPADAESVFRIEGLEASTTPAITGEVLVAPFDDRQSIGSPAVYRIGARYFGAGGADDPTAGALRLFYARRPAALTALSDTIDPDWPEQFNGIFEYEIAAFNARSDGGREGELVTMTDERDRLIQLFTAFLEHETSNETRRFGEVRWTATERREPLNAMTTRT